MGELVMPPMWRESLRVLVATPLRHRGESEVKYRIVAVTKQTHDIGFVNAADEAEAIRLAQRYFKKRLEDAAKRCYKTHQLYDILAQEERRDGDERSST